MSAALVPLVLAISGGARRALARPTPAGGQLGEMVEGPLPLADRFTVGHGMLGFMLGLAQVPWYLVLGQAVLWDLIENPLKKKLPSVFPDSRPDTLAHAIVDITACMAGYGATRLLPPGPMPEIWKAAAR